LIVVIDNTQTCIYAYLS